MHSDDTQECARHVAAEFKRRAQAAMAAGARSIKAGKLRRAALQAATATSLLTRAARLMTPDAAPQSVAA